MSFDICVWDKCNNRCRMCTNPDRPWPAFDGSFEYDYESLMERLEKKKDEIKNQDVIYLTGGEPTIHPQFREILQYLKNNFPSQIIRLLSNGRSFSYEKYAAECLALVPSFEIEMSLYGPNEKIHDAVTRAPGSFVQSLAGLKNLLRYRQVGQIIGLRFVITRDSYQYLEEFFSLFLRELSAVDRLIIIFPEYEAQAIKNLDNILLTYTEFAAYLFAQAENIKKVQELTELRLYHLPLCQLSKDFWPLTWKTWPESEVQFLPTCENCRVKKYCVGPQRGYLENVGDSEFKALATDFDIVETGDEFRPIGAIKN